MQALRAGTLCLAGHNTPHIVPWPCNTLHRRTSFKPNITPPETTRWRSTSTTKRIKLQTAAQFQNSDTVSTSSIDLAACTRGSLLRGQLGNEGGDSLWFEVRRKTKDGFELLCDGEALTLKNDTMEMAHNGYWPRLSDAWVKKCPELQNTLKSIRKQQEADGSLPSQLIARHGLASLTLLTSLDAFSSEVNSAPSYWCDGTGPNDPPPTETQTALLTAGELIAFLNGHRGVCLLQLAVGWDAGAGPPLLRPFVFTLLEQVCSHKGVGILLSPAPGKFGASLVLHAKQQPFKAWATFLAGTGVQAALVADSPYYKLVIGYILGYKEENILHHIASYGGHVTSKVIATAQEDLAKLSPVAPQLPWPARKK